jgi:drug/metabolite transporter (DMT)-like permease
MHSGPDAGEIGHSLVAGSLVHGLYLGGVFTAISQGVPAGIAALIPGLQSIMTSTIANRFMGEKVTRVQRVGLALGLVGVLLVLHDRSITLVGSARFIRNAIAARAVRTRHLLHVKRAKFAGAPS